MAFRCSCACAFVLSACVGMAAAQQVPLVQPGAPGQPNKVITNPVGTAVHEPTAADFGFMQGMVIHHSQAVEMVGLMNGRTTNPQMLEMGKRISISQGDEIAFMKRWLSFYGKPVQENKMDMDMDMPGMDMSHMDHGKQDMDTAVMPGMLTPRQMQALRNAKGAQFDHLFLTGMIQHHTGALNMVKELFETKDGGQEPQLFDFTADVDVTQRAEIETMQSMLAKEKK
ncbi:DUF305 domain-containing protein [Terriglobus sp. TAA 43]|uniref:DUF305 domain-containing protein n=1 Tax=Terriglobus sp. TAA 43 TaxID=278961 RepID=UPI0006456FC6|nr:DUF305 domain-containing protein [Terriglobus sp. TAA 43]